MFEDDDDDEFILLRGNGVVLVLMVNEDDRCLSDLCEVGVNAVVVAVRCKSMLIEHNIAVMERMCLILLLDELIYFQFAKRGYT